MTVSDLIRALRLVVLEHPEAAHVDVEVWADCDGPLHAVRYDQAGRVVMMEGTAEPAEYDADGVLAAVSAPLVRPRSTW
jgi:hypothetical protein